LEEFHLIPVWRSPIRGGIFPAIRSRIERESGSAGGAQRNRNSTLPGDPGLWCKGTGTVKFINKAALRGTTCITTAAIALAVAPAAFAQDTAPADTATEACSDTDNNGVCDDVQTSGAIVVTGSRIRQPNLESANPVANITGEDIFETGGVSLGDILNDLPQLRSTLSAQNSTRGLGIKGLNLLDLRGLGPERTLVLVNGRRHVAADVLFTSAAVDINSIPSALIQRVDIVTGGASAVYGSDAIAGVVNFILKDNFEGVEARAQAGVSKYGDAGNQFVSVTAGKNFGADDRGNVAISGEFAHTSEFFASGRPNLRQNNAFVVTDTDPSGSDGVFDRTFFRDIRSTTISLGGQLGIAQSRTTPGCGADYLGQPYTCAFLFQPDGTLVAQTGQRVGIAPNASFIGGNGSSSREANLISLTPDVKRYSVNLIGHYEISPALVPFIEAKYSRTDAFGSQSGPFFNQGTGTIENSATTLGYNRERFRLDNPFLSTQARTLITQQILAAGVDPNSTSTTPAALTAAQRTQIANGSFRVALRRNYLELGVRDELFQRETYRLVGGIRGDFNDDWNYELSLNYGKHKEFNEITNNVSRQRFLLAIDTTRNAAGQIVCRSQVDPTATGVDRGNGLIPSQLAADVAACVPLNPFGDGNISQAAKDYLRVTTSARGKISQFDALGFVAGDLSQLFELPGGPIGFALGGEYRRQTYAYNLDDYTEAGYAFYNAIPAIDAPKFTVKEAFGEIQVPLLKDTPFFHELSLKGSGRISDYSGATGTVYTYGGEAVWAPIEDIRFRGTYNHSVRAPNQRELYRPQGQNFAPAPNDPCSARNIGTGSATRAANCAAAGRPAGYDFVYTSSLEIKSGGNPNLREESSDSYTVGVIVQPRFIPGLSVSADFYDIKVNDVITATGSAQDILNLCYDSPTLNNPFCDLFQRAGPGGGANGEIPFQVLKGSLLQASANFAALRVRGIDTQLEYRHDFGWAKANLSVLWNHQLKNEAFTNPADPTFKDVFKGELNDPDDQVNVDVSLQRGKVTLGYGQRWIDHMYLNTFEDYNSVNGNPPGNEDFAPIKRYPGVFYHDVRVGVDVNENFNAYLGVDNLTDKKPPFGLTGVGAGSGIYDNRGRYMYAGVKFGF
jgi:outer membrane receptor protein involved in Fe transport